MKIKSEIGHRSAPASKEAAEFGLRAEEGEYRYREGPQLGELRRQSVIYFLFILWWLL